MAVEASEAEVGLAAEEECRPGPAVRPPWEAVAWAVVADTRRDLRAAQAGQLALTRGRLAQRDRARVLLANDRVRVGADRAQTSERAAAPLRAN